MGRLLDDRTGLDGIRGGGTSWLGIDQAGRKQILGLAEGATENFTLGRGGLVGSVWQAGGLRFSGNHVANASSMKSPN
jgi:hypothetical protein